MTSSLIGADSFLQTDRFDVTFFAIEQIVPVWIK